MPYCVRCGEEVDTGALIMSCRHPSERVACQGCEELYYKLIEDAYQRWLHEKDKTGVTLGLVKVGEMARRVGVVRETVGVWRKKGFIPSVKVSNLYLYNPAAVILAMKDRGLYKEWRVKADNYKGEQHVDQTSTVST